jgi:carboxypeptidase PM20D1
VIRLLLLLVIILAVGLVGRGLTLGSLQPEVSPVEQLPVDAQKAAERLAESVRISTVSHEDSDKIDRSAFLRLHALLEKFYPVVHERLQREVVNDLSLLYTWPGSDPDLPAAMLTAHLDVVPADASDWSQPPFAGNISGGFVWGRGTMDDKVGVLGILEAAEHLLAAGFEPARTIHFAFGQDEELDGHGADAIAARLKEQGAKIDFVLDEGMMIVEGIVPGLGPPAALIGLAEKGYANVTLAVETSGGHSSIPPDETAVGILSAAVARLEANPMPARLEGPVEQMFRWLSPEMPLVPRIVLGNLWLFDPLVRAELAGIPATNAIIRTTAAPTMLSASEKANVLARRANAVVNYRLLPGDSLDDVRAHVRRVVDDPRVKITFAPGEPNAATPVSPVNSESFQHIASSVRAVFPQVVVAPSLVIPATDARHYGTLTSNVFRLLPIVVTAEDLDRFHGIDERIAVKGYVDAINFYAEVMRRSSRQ